jgi:hypothetical protein
MPILTVVQVKDGSTTLEAVQNQAHVTFLMWRFGIRHGTKCIPGLDLRAASRS